LGSNSGSVSKEAEKEKVEFSLNPSWSISGLESATMLFSSSACQ
jgi:hypothetical protein